MHYENTNGAVCPIEIQMDFVTQRKPSHATTKLTLLAVSKDEWNTKEDTGNVLFVLRYAKRHLLG